MTEIRMLKRNDVLSTWDRWNASRERRPDVLREMLVALPFHYAPNPQQLGRKNIMGQTEEEFFEIADRDEPR